MAKKKEVMESFGTTMTPAQFWEWRCTLEKWLHAKSKGELGLTQLKLMEKNIEIDRLNSILFKQKVQNKLDHANIAKEEYQAVIKRLESELGVSLTEAVIDEVTFEVKKLEETPQS